jgi:hypothetical protein
MFMYWVQHADFSVDELGEITREEALALFRDWRQHGRSPKAPADPLPIAIGFDGEADYRLTVSASGDGYNVWLSAERPRKWFGRGNVLDGEIRNGVSDDQLLEIIDAFFTRERHDVLQMLGKLGRSV